MDSPSKKPHYCFSLFSPYIIGTMNQGVSSSPNLELHHNFRYIHSVFAVAMFTQFLASQPSSSANIDLASHRSKVFQLLCLSCIDGSVNGVGE